MVLYLYRMKGKIHLILPSLSQSKPRVMRLVKSRFFTSLFKTIYMVCCGCSNIFSFESINLPLTSFYYKSITTSQNWDSLYTSNRREILSSLTLCFMLHVVGMYTVWVGLS